MAVLQSTSQLRRSTGLTGTRRRMPARGGWWLFSAAVLAFGYLPLLTAHFGRHNDYLLWACERWHGLAVFPETWHLLALGRPLGALLLNLQFTCLGSLHGFLVSRWVALIVTLIAVWLLADHLARRPGVARPTAVCAAACVFLLPASQLFVSWVTNFVPGTLTVVLSLVAYRVLDGGPEPASVRSRFEPWQRVLIAGTLYFVALLIYPPTALFILVPTFGNVVFSRLDVWPETRRRLVRDVVFVALGLLAFFVFLRFVYLPIVVQLWPNVGVVTEQNRTGPYELTLGLNLHRWARNLRDVVLVASAGSLHAVVGDHAAIRLAKLVCGGLFLAGAWWFWRLRPGGRPAAQSHFWWAGQRCLAGAALFVLSEVPAIFAQVDGLAGYRVVFPAEAMVTLVLFAILSAPAPWRELASGESNGPRSIVLVPVLLLFGLAAYWNTTNVAANSLRELNYFRQELAKMDLRTTRNLRVICPAKVGVFVERPLKMDFRYAGTNHDLGVPGIVEAVFAEEGRKRGDLIVSVVHAGSPAIQLAQPDETRTIDVTCLLLPRR